MSFLRRIFGWGRTPEPLPHVVIPDPAVDTLGAASLPADTRGGPVPDSAVRIVAQYEGFRARPYLCPAGVPTIGYGATRHADGRPVRMTDPPITEAAAMELLRRQLREFAGEVDRLVAVPLAEHERAALISFAFNVGSAALARSTLLRLLNAGDRDGASGQFVRWNQGGGKVLAGLVNRRTAETRLFRGLPPL